jgi:tetratricopeptide (TPR) repeat protein
MFLLVGGVAKGRDDPDAEIAKRHFAIGANLYQDQNYAAALAEFETAAGVYSAPELEFNIARCLDRLERSEDAVHHYESFLRAQPNAADAAEVRARISLLRRRLARSPQTARHRYAWPIGIGAATLLLGATAAGLLGSVGPELAGLKQTGCDQPCGQLDALKARASAGDAFLGLAVAAAAVDVVLWTVAARRHGLGTVVRVSRRPAWSF